MLEGYEQFTRLFISSCCGCERSQWRPKRLLRAQTWHTNLYKWSVSYSMQIPVTSALTVIPRLVISRYFALGEVVGASCYEEAVLDVLSALHQRATGI